MIKPREPLTLQLVDEGRFIGQTNEDLLDMQAKLLNFVCEHGDDAKGAKAKLTIEITLKSESPKDGMFSIKAMTKTSLPSRPANVTMAISEATHDGVPCLGVRASGSDASNPRQGKFCTDDGRAVPSGQGT